MSAKLSNITGFGNGVLSNANAIISASYSPTDRQITIFLLRLNNNTSDNPFATDCPTLTTSNNNLIFLSFSLFCLNVISSQMFVNWHKNTICFFGILIFLCTFAVQKLGKQNQKNKQTLI